MGDNADETLALLELCESTHWAPSPERVRALVEDGADICYQGPTMFQPLLHMFIRMGNVSLVRACLESSHRESIDFTTGDSKYDVTPLLHVLCADRTPDSVATSILALIVEHIQTHPHDRINWAGADEEGNDFLSHAAQNQKLSLFWPIVKSVPYFDDHVDPFPIFSSVWKWDWEALGRDEQAYFTLKKELIPGSRSTAALIQHWEDSNWKPESVKVQEFVKDGADVFFEGPNMFMPFIQEVVRNGLIECLEACLTTSFTLDFTARNKWNRTPLIHLLCEDFTVSTGDAIEMLSLLLQRLEKHPEDTIDWSQEDRYGYNFLSNAAFYHRLSAFWSLVKHLPFFQRPASEKGDLRITRLVFRADWEQLDPRDQERFQLDAGLSS